MATLRDKPSNPPNKHNTIDSTRKENRILERLNPIARSVPISRSATRNGCIHRVRRSKHRSKRQEAADDVTDKSNRNRCRHLTFEVRRFSNRFQFESFIADKLIDQFVAAINVASTQIQDRDRTLDSPRARQVIQVGPDFRLSSTSASLEVANDG